MLRVCLVLVMMIGAPTAFAWDDEGHMMVAQIAWRQLTPASRARVSALLALNPDYAGWIIGIPRVKRSQIAFVRAATWADAIKRRTCGASDATDACYQHDGDTPTTDPRSAQNIGYADHLQHRYWHYIDIPFSTDGTPLVQPPSPNAETQILLFESALASAKIADDVKSYDLVWLEHLVGDIHQPLHATARFSVDLPGGDRGGNSIAIAAACTTRCPDELHAFWDDLLGTRKTPAAAIAAADPLPPASARAARAEVSTWIKESVAIAERVVYAPPVGPGKGPYTLTPAYERIAHETARVRVELAGARLAHLINGRLR